MMAGVLPVLFLGGHLLKTWASSYRRQVMFRSLVILVSLIMLASETWAQGPLEERKQVRTEKKEQRLGDKNEVKRAARTTGADSDKQVERQQRQQHDYSSIVERQFPVDASLARERTTEHLHIYTDLSEEELRFYANFFEEFILHFRQNYLALSKERPLTVYLFGNMQSYASYSEQHKAPRTPFGYYLGKFNVMVVNLDSGLGTATHELVHHLLKEGSVKPCPYWVQEGVAEFFEKFLGYIDDQGKLHISFGYFSNWRFPETKGRIDEVSLSTLVLDPYADSGVRSFILFLHKKGLLKPFLRELDLREGDPYGLAALKRVSGVDLMSLEREWKEWIRSQPIDDNVLLVQKSFVKTQQDWNLWWKTNRNRLYWDEEEQMYFVKGVEAKRLNRAARPTDPTSEQAKAATTRVKKSSESPTADDLAEIGRFIRPAVNVRNEFGATPLFQAVSEGDTEAVKLLLANKADVAASIDGVTPLWLASSEGHAAVVKLLLAAGANVNDARRTDGATPLMMASQEGRADVVKLLLAAGATVNAARKPDGATPLMMASLRGHIEVVKLLLANKADVAASIDGVTPLWLASSEGDAKVVRLLLANKADVNAKQTTTGCTSLWQASQEGRADVVKLLLAAGASVNDARRTDGVTPLMMASLKGHIEVVKLLLAAGATVNAARKEDGVTPLLIASHNGHAEVVKLLLANKAHVNDARKTDGATSLFVASLKGHIEVVKLLLAAGADVHAKTARNDTPLSVAKKTKRTEIAELLKKHGARE
jgi:ankyrin repeat protein